MGTGYKTSPTRLRSPNIYSNSIRSNATLSAFTVYSNKIDGRADNNRFTQMKAGSVDRLLTRPNHWPNS
jgi:hypothetical protein